jgi:hypothetical protein
LGSRVRPNVFYRSDFSHPISHRTPHYRVGNGVIGWLVISQKRLIFWMKRYCTVQGKMGCNGLGNRRPSQKKCEPKLRDIAPAESEGHIFGTGDDYRPQAADRCRVFRISQTHAVWRRDGGTRRSSAVGLHAILLGHQLGHKLPVTKRLRITSKFLVLLAEGVEFERVAWLAAKQPPLISPLEYHRMITPK